MEWPPRAPIRLQETKNLASWPFTLEAKVQRPSLSKTPTWHYFFTKATDSRRKSKLDWNGNPKYGQETVKKFSLKESKFDKILAVRLEWFFWTRNKVGCFFFMDWIWTLGWPLEASHYTRPKTPIPMFYWLLSAHFFRLSTKLGHSIPRPLDLHGHSVKWPSICISLT
jgi:hypothetical protein